MKDEVWIVFCFLEGFAKGVLGSWSRIQELRELRDDDMLHWSSVENVGYVDGL